MFRIVLLVLSTTMLVQCMETRIVGGSDTTITNYPYQVSITYNGEHHCGGSILSNQWILTAAHCVYGLKSNLFGIRVGSTYIASGGTVVTSIQSIISHELYDEDDFDYDVAVIKLSSTLTLSTTVSTISLADSSYSIAVGTIATVTGWGKTSAEGDSPKSLQVLTVPIIDQTICSNIYIYYNTVTAQMICAGYTTGTKDTCQGDSGGPLVYNGVQIGIVSWGAGCAASGFPGVYARISALRAWITKQTSL